MTSSTSSSSLIYFRLNPVNAYYHQLPIVFYSIKPSISYCMKLHYTVLNNKLASDRITGVLPRFSRSAFNHTNYFD